MQRMTGIASGTECVRRECRHAFMVLAAALTPTMPVAAQCGDMELWPSGATELRAQPDSSIEPQADGSMLVRTGTQYRWPGARMEFRSGLCDLSAYGSIRIAVSNVSERALTVHLSVKGDLMQGESPGGGIRLAPRAAGELKVELCSMPCVLDAPLAFVGMRGYPKHTNGGAFDVRKTRSFHIFVLQDGKPAEFCVRRIVASCAAANTRILPAKILSAKTFMPFVDKFGQFAHDDWPGKVHDDGELAAARSQEEKWFKDHPGSPIPDADRFGGWAKGPQLKATGHFRTEKVDGKWWLVDPDGHLFFSHGVNVIGNGRYTGVGGRERYFEKLPPEEGPEKQFWGVLSKPVFRNYYSDPAHIPAKTFNFNTYNLYLKYGDGWLEKSRASVRRRMRSWGLNTVGAWSDKAFTTVGIPYTRIIYPQGRKIETMRMYWGTMIDPFSPEFLASVKECAKWLKPYADDPWCIGYFSNNEQSWDNSETGLARNILAAPDDQPAKVEFLRRLAEKGIDPARVPDSELRAFGTAVAEKYYSTVRDAVRAVAPQMLYLGDRLAWGCPDVVRAAAKYADVVSMNIYDFQPSRDLPPGSDDKPLMATEFHFGCYDTGYFYASLVPVKDQAARAAAYREYVRAALDHPRYVGAHWFSWRDFPISGDCYEGANAQCGLVNVADVPYPALVEAVRDVAAEMHRRRLVGPKSDAPSACVAKGLKLVWSDEFDYENSRLEEKWVAENKSPSHILCSRWRENAVVTNGMLRLCNRKESRGGKEWTSASVWTKTRFKYGYFECRYRYAAATGTNNSFWFETLRHKPGEGFEIDVNEGHYSSKINTNIHDYGNVYVKNGKKRHKVSGLAFDLGSSVDLSKDFHVYGLAWTADELVFYFDGREIRRVKNEACHSECELLLSEAIIKWAGPVGDAIDGTFMEVDYVRVYELPGASVAEEAKARN